MNSLQFQAFEIFKKHSFSAEEAEAVKIKETELNIIKWIAGMLIAQIGLTLAILKFIEKI